MNHASASVPAAVPTPPMGWNSWYCFSEGVSDARVREAARGMADRGLAAHGWSYINVDDCWQGERGGPYGAIQGNERFPDMKALGDHIHGLGLRFGIYSTPWICSYAGFIGGTSDGGKEIALRLPEGERLQKYQFYGTYPGGRDRGVYRIGPDWHFDADARQWADWGVDFVKVDWNPNDPPTLRRVAADIERAARPMILSVSNTAALEDAAEISRLARMWRISGDVRDNWESIHEIGFNIAPRWLEYMRPGHWLDLDMLQIGDIGTPGEMNPTYRPSRLSFEEQKTQMVLWSLYSAPLLLSCDLAGMDDRSFGLLTNPMVLAVDQDPLCRPPAIDRGADGIWRYEKPLADGRRAVAFFNLTEEKRIVEAGVSGTDAFGAGAGRFATLDLLPHGCALILADAEA